MVWIFTAAIVASIGYFLANLPALYARVKVDRAFPALSRYVFEPTPDIVLVGSSMTYRLYEGYFQIPVRNLAIGGGSPLTGLAIIASYKKLPRTILIETNIMSRPVDDALVSAFGHNDIEPFSWFRPMRALISYVYYWLKYQRENITDHLRGAPEDRDIAASVSAANEEYKSDRRDNDMARNTEAMKHLVEQLEQRGCHVMFLEMPFPPPLGESHYAVTARKLTRNAFLDKDWINVMPNERELRWLDASHLDERSAIVVAREINQIIRAP